MRWLWVTSAIVVAVLVGVLAGWRWVFAPLLGYLFIRWSIGSMRAMVADGRAVSHLEEPQPTPVGRTERVLYWCQECGTELLLLVRGTGKAPRHCAQSMHAREELAAGD